MEDERAKHTKQLELFQPITAERLGALERITEILDKGRVGGCFLAIYNLLLGRTSLKITDDDDGAIGGGFGSWSGGLVRNRSTGASYYRERAYSR